MFLNITCSTDDTYKTNQKIYLKAPNESKRFCNMLVQETEFPLLEFLFLLAWDRD